MVLYGWHDDRLELSYVRRVVLKRFEAEVW
jgi:hypothetical protein